MPNNRWVAIYEGLFGLIAFGALATENIVRSVRGINVLTDVWYYFTYQSGLIVALVLLASSYSFWTRKNWKWLDPLRGAATLYSVITGVVFAVLVHDASPAVMIDHHTLHQMMPIVMVVGWFIHQPAQPISLYRTIKWLYYPWAYAFTVLVIGNFSGTYPYDFLDPTKSSYQQVYITICILTLFAALVSWVLVRLSPRLITLSQKLMWAKSGV